MADLFTQAFGLVEWRETKAENTCENARYSAEILRNAGIHSALVVTHAWHMPRAILAFRRAGFDMVPAPLHGDTREVRGISDFLPHTSAWMRSFYALHEWIGLLAYRAGHVPPPSPDDALNDALNDVWAAVSPDGFPAIPPTANSLFDTVGAAQLFTSRPWYDAFLAAGLEPDAEPLFLVLGSDTEVRAVMPCQRSGRADAVVSSLTSFYSCDFQPLIAAGQDRLATAPELGRQLADRVIG